MGFNKIGIEYFEDAENLIEIYKNDAFKKHPKEVIELLKMFNDETLF
jgi:UTP:GlnB (protein PII) uridylyltransferase